MVGKTSLDPRLKVVRLKTVIDKYVFFVDFEASQPQPIPHVVEAVGGVKWAVIEQNSACPSRTRDRVNDRHRAFFESGGMNEAIADAEDEGSPLLKRRQDARDHGRVQICRHALCSSSAGNSVSPVAGSSSARSS